MEQDTSSQHDGLEAETQMPLSGLPAGGTFPFRLKTGELVAGRFLIVRFIGRGGMGEVYEVEDRQLHGLRIALKTLLPHVSADTAMQRSLAREVMLARSVHHPNVCPIYDIAQVERSGESLIFLTMQLLPGRTLATRLALEPKLTLAEAEAILKKVAAGLDAAHAAGIVHRDIKTSNIIVSGSGANARVWITDFGLARSFTGETTVISSSVVMGTPGYLAPELYEGRPATVCSDIFAFGVVARKTFEAAEEPPSAVWQRVISNCLAPDPAARFPSLEAAMNSLQEGTDRRTDRRADRRMAAIEPLKPVLTRRRMIAWCAGAGVVALAGGAYEIYRRDHAFAPLPSRRFVALLAWPQTPNGDAAIVATLLDSIGNRLARAEAYVSNLMIISSPDVRSVPRYDSTPASVVSDEGANLVLAAALSHTESMVTLTLQVLEAETSHILRRRQTTVTGGAISVLAEKASALAAELLDLPRDVSLSDPDELDQASASTFRLYSEAKALVEQPNDTGLDAGILKYQQLVNDNPHFALGYAQLSLAYTRQYILHHVAGSLDMANSNADLALEYNPRSALALRSKALALLYSGRTNEALDKLDTALQVDPENPETLLYKAQALEYLNRGKDAVTVFDKILKNRPNYWPAHNEFGLLLFRQARYKDAAKAFEDASVIAPQVALPLANLGTMYLTMGDTQMASDALNRSLRRAPNYIAYLSLGDMAFIAGDYSKALTNYTRARDLKPASDIPWRDLGDTYAMLKRPAQVRESYANAARLLSAALKDNPNDGVNWMTMAFYRAKVGDAAEARESLRQAKAYGATDVESQLTEAQVLALLGEKEEAIQLVLDCLKKGISPSEINLALDLKDVRLDPRYKAAVARARS